jgi:hypothetical protein
MMPFSKMLDGVSSSRTPPLTALSSILFCSFSASFFPRFDFGEDVVSDFRFVPAARFDEESF